MDNSPGLHAPTGNSSILSWEQTCCLLGGGSWEEANRGASSSATTSQQKNVPSFLDENSTHQPQYFFSSRHQTPWPLEVFWLKWRLLTSLAHQLLDSHSSTGKPILDLCPKHAQVTFPSLNDPSLPPRWGFSPFFLPSNGALPYTPPSPTPLPPDFAYTLFQPPQESDPLFSHPQLQGFSLGRQESVTALIRSIEPAPPQPEGAKSHQGMLTVHLLAETLSSHAFSEKDVFFIRLPPRSGSFPPLEMWAKPVESAERGLVVQGKCQPLQASDWDHFYQNQREAFPESQVTIYGCFHVPCDLYSLGMMIFYTLLGCRPERWQSVTQTIPSLLASLIHIVQSVNPDDAFEMGYGLRRRLFEEDQIFSKHQVLNSSNSPSSGFGVIPDILWDEAFVIAFKLISHIPGFSFCSHQGDFDLQAPSRPMEQVVHGMEKLGEGIRLELFGQTPRNTEILRACQMLRQELFPQEAST